MKYINEKEVTNDTKEIHRIIKEYCECMPKKCHSLEEMDAFLKAHIQSSKTKPGRYRKFKQISY